MNITWENKLCRLRWTSTCQRTAV